MFQAGAFVARLLPLQYASLWVQNALWPRSSAASRLLALMGSHSARWDESASERSTNTCWLARNLEFALELLALVRPNIRVARSRRLVRCL